MRCYIHGGNDVSRELLVEHHKFPQGYGGPDIPDNIVYICATCHTLLHKMEAALFAKNPGKANDLAAQYLPNDPRRRTILLALANQAASAKREYHERNPNAVPEDPDEVEERTVKISLDLPESIHSRLKTLAMSHIHRKSGRKVGLYRYILQVLENHVENDHKMSRGAINIPKEWTIM